MQSQKGINKKNITFIIVVFAMFLVVGIVFAATTGVLTLNGSVSRGESVDLDFISVACSPAATTTGVPTGDGVTVSGVAGGDYNCGVALSNGLNPANGANDVLTWGIFLREPGDSQSITFSIKNVGSTSVDLSAISVDTSTGFGSSAGDISLSGTGTTISAACLDAGDIIGPFTINVSWPILDTAATAGATFTATMNYAQAVGTCP